jgi:hypothetical protein
MHPIIKHRLLNTIGIDAKVIGKLLNELLQLAVYCVCGVCGLTYYISFSAGFYGFLICCVLSS